MSSDRSRCCYLPGILICPSLRPAPDRWGGTAGEHYRNRKTRHGRWLHLFGTWWDFGAWCSPQWMCDRRTSAAKGSACFEMEWKEILTSVAMQTRPPSILEQGRWCTSRTRTGWQYLLSSMTFPSQCPPRTQTMFSSPVSSLNPSHTIHPGQISCARTGLGFWSRDWPLTRRPRPRW